MLNLLHHMLERLHDDDGLRHRSHPRRDHGRRSLRAQARGLSGSHPYLHRGRAQPRRFPPRYVGGYFHRDDGVDEQEAGHAWAEAFVPELGWVAFDAANGLCATDAHVRVAVGLDYLGAAPLRGTRYGGGGEVMSVKVRVDQASQQTQN